MRLFTNNSMICCWGVVTHILRWIAKFIDAVYLSILLSLITCPSSSLEPWQAAWIVWEISSIGCWHFHAFFLRIESPPSLPKILIQNLLAFLR
jgi:hypothetical protein